MRSSSLIAAGALVIGLGSTALADSSAWTEGFGGLLGNDLPAAAGAFAPPNIDLGKWTSTEGRSVVVVVSPTAPAAPPAPWFEYEPLRFETGLIACINDKAMFRDERGRRSFVDPPAAAQYCG